MRRIIFIAAFLYSLVAFAQPGNDSCHRPEYIPVSSGGYGTGLFKTDTFNINRATLAPGEYFHPDLVSVGNDKKSIWFRFYLPVKRAVKIELKQPNTKINSKDVGFVTYKANTCFPGYNEATNAYITPLNQFGSSFHPCMEAGWYMIQVGSKSSANGPVFIELSISYPVQHAAVSSSHYDLTDSAYQFGTLNIGRNEKFIEYETGCHTLQDSAEYYPAIGSSYKDYAQTSWHVFKTNRRIDYLELLLSEAYANPMLYFPAGTKIYANVYEGNVKTSNYKNLKKIDSCLVFDFDNRITPNGFAGKSYLCKLKNNTFYSIQLIFRHDFYRNIRLTLRQRTADSATLSPRPVRSQMAPNSKLGVLKSSPGGTTTVLRDYLTCDSKLINTACGTVNPSAGVTLNGVKYNLSTWLTFKLGSSANVKFEFLNTNNNQCAGRLAYRLFKDSIPVNCNGLDTSKIYNQGILDGKFMYCVLPGTYSMQILGIDTAEYTCGAGEHIGYNIDIGIKVINSVQYSRYGLSDSTSIDKINGYAPLANNVSYSSQQDEFGCEHSLLPGANRCDTAHKKAIYRLIKIGDADNDSKPDSGLLSVFNMKTNVGPEKIQYVLYNKNLKNLAVSQSKYLYPDTIGNPGMFGQCTNYNVSYNGSSSRYYCVTPGDYTLGAFGGVAHLGIKDQTTFTFTKTKTAFGNKNAPEAMDTIKSTTDSKTDYFSCLNNAEVIDGSIPCGNKKVIYREFYIASPQLVEITNYAPFSFAYLGSNTLYRGRVSAGISGLVTHKDPDGRRWECFTSMRANDCYPLPAGWYTLVSSATGPGYGDKTPLDDVASQNSGHVNAKNRITIKIIKQIASKFNRPFKAWPVNDSLNGGKPLSWKPNYGNRINPKNGYLFNLRTENFTCVPDTPFSLHPLAPCNPNNNHIAYYVFGLEHESYLRVMGLNPNIKAFIFDFDVRKDSAKMATATPVQGCNTYSRIEMCRIKAGTYTLVLMYSNGAVFPVQVSPALYIDSVGTSRFDFASKAYDFGRVPGDSVWYYGKKGTTHPTVSGRAPSSDFFFCTTGSSPGDPTFACGGYYNPNVYPDRSNNPQYNIDSIGSKYTYLGYHAVRNLWYTFTLRGAGKARINIDNLTNGTVWGNNLSYGVYLSDEKGNLNFDTLKKYGRIDSTLSMGLTQIQYQPNSGQCNGTTGLYISKDICDSIAERRYYLVVSLNEAALPNLNSQIAVSIQYDSVPVPVKRFDYYTQANVINGLGQTAPPYTPVTLTSGKLLQGAKGFFNGTTTDTADRTTVCSVSGRKNGTIWYKFKVDSTGTLYFNLRRFTFSSAYSAFVDYTPSNNQYDENVVLMKEITPGDSSSKGLQRVLFDYNAVNLSKFNRDFATACISAGWYYIQVSSCGLDCSDYLVPELVIQFQNGDFCKTPVQLKLNALGSTSGNAVVNCHSIGEGFGEDGSNMGCLYGPNGYKSTWFRLDYNDSSKADIEFQLTEKTNVQPSDIRFRTFYGGCAALTPGPCNTNSQTVFSLSCMKKGSYYVQVVSPASTIGSLDLKVTAKQNLDTSCKPYDTWTPNANFNYTRNCPPNKIKFVNYSTTGDSIKYKWDFGFGRVDTGFAPTVDFPVNTADVQYRVRLLVYNPSRKASDSSVQYITIPATPVVKLRADTAICKGDTVLFKFSHAKYRHYWNIGGNKPVIKIAQTGWVVLTVIQKFGTDSCILFDSAFVKVNPNPVLNLGKDTALCRGDSLQLTGPSKMRAYVWSNGSRSNTVKISNQSIQLQITDSNLCRATDVIQTTLRNYSDTILRPVKPVCVDLSQYIIQAKPKNAGYFYGHAQMDSTGKFAPFKAGAGNHRVFYRFKDAYGCVFRDSAVVRINPLPDASVYPAGPFCADAGIQQLTPKVNSGGRYFGGNYIDSFGRFSSFSAKVGTHKVFYTFKDANGCRNKDSIFVRVNPLPDASLTQSGPHCLLSGIQVITPQKNKGGRFSGGTYIDTSGNFNPQRAGVGTHKVIYRFIDANGCSGRDSTLVTVHAMPDATIAAAGPYCVDAGLQQLSPRINKGGTFYGGSFVDSAGEFNPYTAGVGSHRVYYRYTDANGCSSTDSTRIQVNPLPDASIVSAGPFCLDAGVINLRAKTNAGGTFYGGSYVNSTGAFDTRNAGAGLHKVSYTVTDANGCTNTDSTTIRVFPLPDAGIVSAGPFCIDAGVQQIQPKTNKGGKFTGGNYIDSAGTFNPRVAGIGNFILYYTFTDLNGCTASDSSFIRVNSLPDASIIAAGPYCIDAGIQRLKAFSNPGGTFSGGLYIDSAGNFNPFKAASGNHKIKYTYTDKNKCTGTDSISITVNPLPDTRIQPAGPFCVDAGIRLIVPKTNTGGVFYGGKYIDTAGRFNTAQSGSGNFKVVYKLTDINQCFNKDSIVVRVNPLPDASILSSGPFCVDAGIQLVKAAKNTGGRFFGGSYVDSGGRFNPMAAGSGNHKVYYRYRDGNSCVGLDSIFIRVNPLPDPSVVPAGPFCIDAGIQLIKPKTNPGGRFFGGLFIDNGGNFDPKKAGVGVSKVYYEFTDANKCRNKDSIQVRVNTLPDATITPAGPYCINAGQILLTPRVNPGGKFYGGVFVDSAGNFTTQTAGLGVHRVYYRLTDGNGCRNKDSILIRINPLPDARIRPAGPFCDNDASKIIQPFNTTVPGSFYGTGGPGDYVDALGNFNPVISKSGIHPVFYKVTDMNLCSNIDSIKVLVNAKPVFDFVGKPVEGCVPLLVNFEAAPGYKKYEWDFGNGSTGSGVQTQSIYQTDGKYNVSLRITDNNNCYNIFSKPDYIEAYPRPKANFNYSPFEINLSITPVQFTNFSTGAGITSYRWDVDGVFETDQKDFSKIFHDSGYLKINLLAVNKWGCRDSTSQYIFVIDTFIIFIPNAFSPNQDGVNDQFTVGGIGIRYLDMTIYNRWGEKLFYRESGSNDFGWDGYYLDEVVQQGAYMYMIHAKDNRNRTYLFKGMVTVLK